ncbi:MAG: transposase [Opitutaceae bacterium]|nr:transposase [Opitutaceae bacterium]
MTAGRAGISMTLLHRKYLPHGTPSWVRAGAVFFITLCCRVRGENGLCRREIAAAIFEAVNFRQHTLRWHMHLLLLMPDHLHALVSFPKQEEMRKVMAGFKEATAKRGGVDWQRDFFDHRLRNDRSLEEKADYIRMNPVRKGLVASPADWKWVWETDADGAPGGRALPDSGEAQA